MLRGIGGWRVNPRLSARGDEARLRGLGRGGCEAAQTAIVAGRSQARLYPQATVGSC
jgi:hypothetical protein